MRSSLVLALALSAFVCTPSFAQEKPMTEGVVMDLVAEDWVKTDTARVVIGVEAAVSEATAGGAREDMMKAVNDIAKADWRLTNFNRSQDQTGLERWSASFEARLPENKLNGLTQIAQKKSRAGLQLTIAQIDFTPTLAETQKGYSTLRAQLYKDILVQQALLKETLPGQNYHIALVDFTDVVEPSPMPMRANLAVMSKRGDASVAPMDRAEKIVQKARVVFTPTTK